MITTKVALVEAYTHKYKNSNFLMGKGSKTVSNHLFEGINKATAADVRKAYIVFSEKLSHS